MERFFLDALDQVRQVKAKQIEERRKAQLLFHREMVRQGKALDFPQIQKSGPVKRNADSPGIATFGSPALQQELADAEMQSNNDSNSSFHRKSVDIAELSLDEKEKVIRLLFDKMNGSMTDSTYTAGHGEGIFSGPNKLRFDMVQTPVTPSGYSSPDSRSLSISPVSKSVASSSPTGKLSSGKVVKPSSPAKPRSTTFHGDDDPDVISVKEDREMLQDEQASSAVAVEQKEPQFPRNNLSHRSLTRLKNDDDDDNDNTADNGAVAQDEEAAEVPKSPKSPKSSLKRTENSTVAGDTTSATPQSPRRNRVQFHNQVHQLEFQKEEEHPAEQDDKMGVHEDTDVFDE